MITPTEIVDKASKYAFDKPLVANNFRAVIVEAIVSAVLPEGWEWCSEDWAGWDFEHSDGTRLEVKQSAAKQSWPAPKRLYEATFDIRPRTGYYEGADWIASPTRCRFAHIYLFAYHPRRDALTDHRDPTQWEFYSVPEVALPAADRISLSRVQRLAASVLVADVGKAVEATRLTRSIQQPPDGLFLEG
jgi:hypothetical protein